MYDVLIINALLVDGMGQPGYVTDIAIKGDRISALGTPSTDRNLICQLG